MQAVCVHVHVQVFVCFTSVSQPSKTPQHVECRNTLTNTSMCRFRLFVGPSMLTLRHTDFIRFSGRLSLPSNPLTSPNRLHTLRQRRGGRDFPLIYILCASSVLLEGVCVCMSILPQKNHFCICFCCSCTFLFLQISCSAQIVMLFTVH